EDQGRHAQCERETAFQLRSIERMLMKKLAKMVCVPSESKTTAGITSRIGVDGFRFPNPTDCQLVTARINATRPPTTISAPASSPTSRVMYRSSVCRAGCGG